MKKKKNVLQILHMVFDKTFSKEITKDVKANGKSGTFIISRFWGGEYRFKKHTVFQSKSVSENFQPASVG